MDRRRIVQSSFEQTNEFPDLRSSINIKFPSTKSSLTQQTYENGFDYGDQYIQIYDEHRKSANGIYHINGYEHSGSYKNYSNDLTDSGSSLDKSTQSPTNISTIWCMDYKENLIVIGCANGSLEFWEGTTGRFKVRDLIMHCYFKTWLIEYLNIIIFLLI